MANERILIIDDERGVAESLARVLRFEGYAVDVATTAAEAQAYLARDLYDAALIDLRMPEVSGIDVLDLCRRADPAIAALMLTAYGTVEAAARAFKLGAKDFLAKPVRREDLLAAVQRALDASRLLRAARAEQRQGRASFADLVGKSPCLTRLLDQAASVAASDLAVVILGESGTGKDLVARAIHAASPRAAQPLVTALIPAAGTGDLQKSALFGHVPGAFTGAVGAHRGYFREADRGTLFLDEVGELALETQVVLLRAVENKVFRPLGADRDLAVDVRILSATNRDLEAEVQAGRFRQDLYFRLGRVFLVVPPLRERREDIPLLAAHLIRQFIGADRSLPEIDPDALESLCNYHWPGNVRQLKNVIETALVLAGGGPIRCEHCLIQPARAAEARPAGGWFDLPLKDATDRFLADYLRHLLKRFDRDLQRVADHAGVHVTSIRRKLRELGMGKQEEKTPDH
jgi:DNA-binding NtrC family response regulator